MLYNAHIAIIGAGPGGLSCIARAGMLEMSSIIIDGLNEIGGQCSALYPEKPIYDIPAYPVITGKELSTKLWEQAMPFKPQLVLGEMIDAIRYDEGNWILQTNQGSTIKVKAIIIATGAGAFTPNKPPIPNLESFEDVSVFYSVNKTAMFSNKVVMIVGGGDSAVDWALHLSSSAKKVLLVHRRNKFRALPENVSKLREQPEKITILAPYQLYSLSGIDGQIESVTLQNINTEELEIIETDFLLLFLGNKMDQSKLLNWGLNLTADERHVLVNRSTMETNLAGVFAIGDVVEYHERQGKLKLIMSAFSEGALACHSAYNYVYPDRPLHFEYSTTKGLPRSNEAI